MSVGTGGSASSPIPADPHNPIAALLGVRPAEPGRSRVVELSGRRWLLLAWSPGSYEAIYRLDAGHAVSNPARTLNFVAEHQHLPVLAAWIAGRDGIKRPEAEAIVAAVRAELAGVQS